MRRLIVLSVLCLTMASPAFAQLQTPIRNDVTFVVPAKSSNEAATAMRQVSDRGGFTLLVNLGLGIQKLDEADSQMGLGGANLGIGGFVRPNLAVMGRFSGTNVSYDEFDSSVISGVVGGTAQFWVHERFALEGGGGLGFFKEEGFADGQGWGLILAASGVLVRGGKHNLLAGFEYAPAFINDEAFGESFTIHNLAFTIGYQFSRR